MGWSKGPGLGHRGFFSYIGLLLSLLAMGVMAYFMLKAYFQPPPVSKATAASLSEAGIRTDNYGVLLNSVRQQVSDVEQRMQADADAVNKQLR